MPLLLSEMRPLIPSLTFQKIPSFLPVFSFVCAMSQWLMWMARGALVIKLTRSEDRPVEDIKVVVPLRLTVCTYMNGVRHDLGDHTRSIRRVLLEAGVQ